jgi:hypothetical protein
MGGMDNQCLLFERATELRDVTDGTILRDAPSHSERWSACSLIACMTLSSWHIAFNFATSDAPCVYISFSIASEATNAEFRKVDLCSSAILSLVVRRSFIVWYFSLASLSLSARVGFAS